jgi:hypothetical protein
LSKAASELFKSQGVSGFYRGIEANVMRAMVLNGTKMVCMVTNTTSPTPTTTNRPVTTRSST